VQAGEEELSRRGVAALRGGLVVESEALEVRHLLTILLDKLVKKIVVTPRHRRHVARWSHHKLSEKIRFGTLIILTFSIWYGARTSKGKRAVE
tara:strand:- start:1693 stop:1971 length:279 start_codon:yes stop_codon:yes gene_type:complete